ncbi:hypothetical protein XH97_18125 [Bradyrhizobium sp. CCBAU 53380]|nr:hypothetical protein [Bradyrhizobium sp. CCBAU 53380]
MCSPTFSNLIAEIKQLDKAISNGLYAEAIETFVDAIESARNACNRGREAAQRSCIIEGVTWPAHAITGFAVEVEQLEHFIKTLATGGLLHPEDKETAEITRAISDAEESVAEAHLLIKQLGMPE